MTHLTPCFATNHLEIAATEEENLSNPPWLAELLLIAQLWRETGLLQKLNESVHVQRGRMGTYQVCDYVLLLLAYAVSGAATLENFFEQLKPVQSVVMAMWERRQTPHRSALSRFLADVNETALASLRRLFEADLFENGVRMSLELGLSDRCGDRYVVFDVDGTRQVSRQRSVPKGKEYPKGRRRLENACAPGYRGHKRGEVVRTRSAVQQAHTQEWLGSYGASGNGTPVQDLRQACQVISDYLKAQSLELGCGVVRLDGLYGTASIMSMVAKFGLGYLCRCKDYRLLKHPQVQACLKSDDVLTWCDLDSNRCREVFDAGFVDWSASTQPDTSLRSRLLVIRRPYREEKPEKLGKKLDGYVYHRTYALTK